MSTLEFVLAYAPSTLTLRDARLIAQALGDRDDVTKGEVTRAIAAFLAAR
jgi:hypothetical protein